MKLLSKVRASLATLIMEVPFLALFFLYRDRLPLRAWVYLGLLSFLAALLIYQWVYHRESVKVATPRAVPGSELNLTPEYMPRVVWLALAPPVLVAVLLWWVKVHGSELQWRDNWLGPPQPAMNHRTYSMASIFVIIPNSAALWAVLYGLAQWHGMPRAYARRREVLLRAVLSQWLILVASVAWMSGMNFHMPPALATTCGIAYGFGLPALMWTGWRASRRFVDDLHIGTWWYFDFGDPAFSGPRGMNLASSWSWALAVAAIVPLLLAEWLLHWTRA